MAIITRAHRSLIYTVRSLANSQPLPLAKDERRTCRKSRHRLLGPARVRRRKQQQRDRRVVLSYSPKPKTEPRSVRVEVFDRRLPDVLEANMLSSGCWWFCVRARTSVWLCGSRQPDARHRVGTARPVRIRQPPSFAHQCTNPLT